MDDPLTISIGGPILEKPVVGKDDVKSRPFTQGFFSQFGIN